MEIIQSSIKDISEQFNTLKRLLAGLNYVVPVESFIFSFIDDSQEFTKQDLDLIFPKEKLIGTLEKTSWENLEKAIFLHLSYCNDHRLRKPEDDLLPMVDNDKATERAKIFWSIVGEHMSLPPTKAYFYHPEEGCYFDDYVMWVLCIVLVNEETKKGIFVYTAAWD